MGGRSGLGRKKTNFHSIYRLQEGDQGWKKLDYKWPTLRGPTPIPLTFLHNNDWPNIRPSELTGKRWSESVGGCMNGYKKSAILEEMPFYDTTWNCMFRCEQIRGCKSIELVQKIYGESVIPHCKLFNVNKNDAGIIFRNICTKDKKKNTFYYELLYDI